MNTLQMSLLLLIISLGFSPTGMASDDEEGGEKPKDATYLKLEPDFIVNLKGGGRPYFMKVTAQVMAHGEDATDTLKQHLPAIRHRLLMLYSEQELNDMRSQAGKKTLMDKSLAEINQVMEDESTGVEAQAIYFTSFVIQ